MYIYVKKERFHPPPYVSDLLTSISFLISLTRLLDLSSLIRRQGINHRHAPPNKIIDLTSQREMPQGFMGRGDDVIDLTCFQRQEQRAPLVRTLKYSMIPVLYREITVKVNPTLKC